MTDLNEAVKNNATKALYELLSGPPSAINANLSSQEIAYAAAASLDVHSGKMKNLYRELKEAIFVDDVSKVEALLDGNPGERTWQLQTPLVPATIIVDDLLCMAVRWSNGNTRVARWLIERGANVNCGSGDPMELAVRGNHISMARLLLDNGANPNGTLDSADRNRRSATHAEVIRALQEVGQGENNPYGRPLATAPLSLAVSIPSGDPNAPSAMVDLLLQRGADPNADGGMSFVEAVRNGCYADALRIADVLQAGDAEQKQGAGIFAFGAEAFRLLAAKGDKEFLAKLLDRVDAAKLSETLNAHWALVGGGTNLNVESAAVAKKNDKLSSAVASFLGQGAGGAPAELVAPEQHPKNNGARPRV